MMYLQDFCSVILKCCFTAFKSIELKEEFSPDRLNTVRFNMMLMMVPQPRWSLSLALLLFTLDKATRGRVTSSATSAARNPFIQDAAGAAMGGERSYVQETAAAWNQPQERWMIFFFFFVFERENKTDGYCKKGSSSSIPHSCKTKTANYCHTALTFITFRSNR